MYTIIVTGYYDDHIDKAHQMASEIFEADRIHEFHIAPPHCMMVTPIVEAPVNRVRSFAILPDGSKEGWDTSHNGDAARAKMIAWLRAQTYDDGSSPFSWVEVQYGDEIKRSARVLRSSDAEYRRKARHA